MLSEEDKTFLKTYNADEYEHPSVTVDMLIFTITDKGQLQLMLIQRKNPPYKDCWAIPGGFVNIDESVKTAAIRELQEETNVTQYNLHQFGVYGEVNRDPRTRVISIAYIAMVNHIELGNTMLHGDDAKAVKLYDISYKDNQLLFNNKELDLAFDHDKIIKDGLEYLRKTINYTDIVLDFLSYKFTLFDAQKVYEIILGKSLNKGNFRRSFINNFVKTGKVEELEEYSHRYQRPAKLYRRVC